MALLILDREKTVGIHKVVRPCATNSPILTVQVVPTLSTSSNRTSRS
jgi:hypothetical protein